MDLYISTMYGQPYNHALCIVIYLCLILDYIYIYMVFLYLLGQWTTLWVYVDLNLMDCMPYMLTHAAGTGACLLPGLLPLTCLMNNDLGYGLGAVWIISQIVTLTALLWMAAYGASATLLMGGLYASSCHIGFCCMYMWVCLLCGTVNLALDCLWISCLSLDYHSLCLLGS